MAYFNQEKKKAIAPAIKTLCAKYGVKGTLSVNHHSTVVLTIKSGKIDFFGSRKEATDRTYESVNVYHINSHYTGQAAKFLIEAKKVLNTGNHNRSDIQTDYFDVGFFVEIHIGRWNKPYILEA